MRALILGAAAVGIFALAFPPSAQAGPGPCVEDPVGVVTCTGDQSSGIASGVDFTSPPITALNVNALSGDIRPAPGKDGISLLNSGGSSVTVKSGTPERGVVITTQGKDASGIVAVSEGSPAGYNWLPGLGVFVPAGSSGSGGPVTVESYTSTTTDGSGSHGIVAQNRIGTYHPLSEFTLRNFSVNQVGLSLISVAGSGTNIGAAVAGDNGGLVTLKADGTWVFDPGTLATTLQVGDSVVTKVSYQVQISHDPQILPYGTQVSDGSIAFKVTKKGDGSIESVPAIYFGQYDAFSNPTNTTPLWPDLQGYVNRLLADMGIAGAGESLLVTNAGLITTKGPSSHGIVAQTEGGTGSTGSSGTFWDSDKIPDPGGAGSNGGAVKIVNDGEIQTHEDSSAGIAVLSRGGTGGKGGDGGPWRYGRPGGTGGTGGEISVEGDGVIHTRGDYSSGILALSAGGAGGTGGSGSGSTGGGSGGFGGKGGNVTTEGSWTITTEGDKAHGVWAKSLGGSAGPGGSGGWLFGKPGSGGQASDGGTVIVTNEGQIETKGADSYGVYAQSVGGFGGTGGTSFGLFWSFGGDGGSAGSGGSVTVSNEAGASIKTGVPRAEGAPPEGARSHAIFAQSIGGGGGSGGGEFALFASLGGEGGAGGNGGAVEVTNAGLLQTSGDNARGIYAQSVGGGGGDGGDSEGLVAIGGKGSETSDGGKVTVTNSGAIETRGYRSHAIFAESVGGGGGDGGDSGGIFTIGGSGGGGGNGGALTITNNGGVTTTGTEASGIFVQSVGGGGGNGGGAVSVGTGLTLAIGGNAGQGGDGTRVDVTSTGDSSIRTGGDRSYGIFAQSVGGGGGNGGFAVTANVGGGIGIAIGGTGGKGGDGGEVEVHASGTIDTGSVSPSGEVSGKEAHGIFAQSVGGGGGTGGFTVQGSLGGGPSFKLGLGGKGGVGGIGNTVSVGTELDPIQASISTVGKRAYGILAQSLGGGGGDGGFSVSGSVASGVTLDLAIGGDGGSGNKGGVVNVHSVGEVTTKGDDAHAIFAQSVGGSGGNGGFSVAGSYGGGVGLKLSFGGDGGTGSAGDTVNVGTESTPMRGTISTSGRRAHGIFAQSVGGGGGNGGSSITGQLLGGQTLQFSFGGDGGTGGAGGAVHVNNAGTITTRGEEGFGILAQSVGGGGGNGGMSLAAAVTAFGGFNFSMGGNGGDGNSGGAVDVNHTGTIETFADYSHGIVAQSVGGGGGTGGMAGSATVNFSSLLPIPPEIPIKGSANFAISLGGEGGTGGQAGAVNVSNAGAITTHEDYAYGIFAQSVGGGGGAGGKSIAATGNISLPESPEGGESKPQLEVKLDFALAIGGKGGNGNTGGAVDIVNRGTIDTSGVGSHGIFAQSVGGGGGEGGNARALTVSIDPSNWSPNGSPPSLSVSKAVNIGIGGSAGGGSDGGSVTISNTGNITTRGADAHGIFAQSVGGGGGAGGSGYHGLDWADLGVPENLVPYFELLPIKSEGDLQIVAGGSGGSSGNGRDVIITNQGRIVTLGDGSFGILAQSIGAGGGTAGIGAVGEEGTVGIGGGGGAAGDGGAVQVTVTGDIGTAGKAAHGIFAQSIGGGGGIAGNVDRGIESFGTNLAFGRDGGSAGDGGAVTITSAGNITTRGVGAYGIFAQSVGGGGGVAGDIGPGIGFAGSVGGDGSAGEITITHTGNITTYGENSHAIFAQSAGGQSDFVLQQTVTLLPDGKLKKDDKGNVIFGAPTRLSDRVDGGGPITIAVNGDIAANGRNSHGILAQSLGDDGNGNVSITVLGGKVQGGSGSGAGVYIADGASNTLANRGTITTIDGLAGTAIRATGGNDTIRNDGTITGSVALGAGRNAFNNNAGATFNAGTTADLGLGNTLTNSGTLSPGGNGTLLTTALTGDLVQRSSGSLEVEVHKDGTHDKLFVNGGTASLDGTLAVLRGQGPYKNGTTYDILEAAQGISGVFANLLPPEPRPLLRFDVTQLPTIVEVKVYAPRVTTVATNPTYQRIAQHLDRIMPDASGDLADVLGEFQALPAGGFDRAFDSLGPMAHDSMTRATFGSTGQYTQSLQRRLEAVRALNRTAGGAPPAGPVLLAAAGADPSLIPILGTYRLSQAQAKNGLWAAGFGQWGDQETTPGFTGFTASTGGLTAGYDYTFGDSLTAGLSVGYADTDVDLAANQGGGRIQGVFPALYASYFTKTAYVDGVLSYGHNWYENDRRLVIGGIQRTAQSEHEGNAFAAYLGGGYAYPLGDWAVGPVGALQYVYLAEQGFQETGAGSLNLAVASRGTNSLVSELGVRVAGTVKTPTGTLIPDLSLLWSYDFDLDDRVLTTTYAGAPGAAFSIQGQPAAQNGLLVRPGLTFVHPAGWSTTLRYAGEFRDGYQAQAVLGEVRVQF